MTTDPNIQALAKRLASTHNYLLEATMNDYSMADLATWSQERGCWVATA